MNPNEEFAYYNKIMAENPYLVQEIIEEVKTIIAEYEKNKDTHPDGIQPYHWTAHLLSQTDGQNTMSLCSDLAQTLSTYVFEPFEEVGLDKRTTPRFIAYVLQMYYGRKGGARRKNLREDNVRRTIVLTESDLHNMVRIAVKKLLRHI